MRIQAIAGVLERNPAAFDAKFKETEVCGGFETVNLVRLTQQQREATLRFLARTQN